MPKDVRPGPPEMRIGGWRVQPALNQISDDRATRRLEPQVMDLLVFLAGAQGRVVSRDDIIEAVWDGRFIAETTLTRSIADLRRALGDTERERRYIETIAKRGYRLIAPVSPDPAAAAPQAAASTADTRLAAEPPSLVVLPFSNLGPDADAYFCEGLTEEIISVLTRVPGLRVISRTSAFVVQRQGGDIAAIGRRLGVTHAIEGSTRRASGRIRVTVQLVRVLDHGHVWSERYDRPDADVFAIQDQIADAVARRLELTLGDRHGRRAAPTRSTFAYSRYLEGRHHFLKGTREGLERAKGCFDEAIGADPSFALAYDAQSELHWYLGFYGLMAPKDAFTKAVWASVRALEIDDRMAESHALLAMLRKELDYDWAEVDRLFASALALDGRSPVVRMRHALCGLMPRGHAAEAAAVLESVAQDDPLSVVVLWWAAVMHWFAGDVARMRTWIARMREVEPAHPLTHMAAGSAHLSESAPTEAMRELGTAADLAGRPSWLVGWQGLACGTAGERGRARGLRDELLAHGAADLTPTALALVAYGLGDLDATFHWLNHAIEVRDPHVIPIRSYPPLGALRTDPRYPSLLARLKLDRP